MNGDDRKLMLDSWLEGNTKIMVATNAFGMGIDKPNVRFVCHYEFPNNLKAPIAARYRGQEMNWFLLELGGDEQPDFEIATDDEFSNFKWVPPNVVIELIAPWKTEAYKTGFKSMGLI